MRTGATSQSHTNTARFFTACRSPKREKSLLGSPSLVEKPQVGRWKLRIHSVRKSRKSIFGKAMVLDRSDRWLQVMFDHKVPLCRCHLYYLIPYYILYLLILPHLPIFRSFAISSHLLRSFLLGGRSRSHHVHATFPNVDKKHVRKQRCNLYCIEYIMAWVYT